MKKRIIYILLVGLIVSSLLGGTNASAVDKSDEEICQQITNTYQKALSASGRERFNGYCGDYVARQIVQLGISNKYIGANGKDQFEKYSGLETTSGGYTIYAYPASGYTLLDALNKIATSGDSEYILIGFEEGSGSAGKLYGHTVFIHAILNGNVYFSESFNCTVGGKYYTEGNPIVCSISTFCNYYNSWAVLDGVIHFSKLHAHNWDSGTITTQPTCTTDGIKTYHCSACSETYRETIAALGHSLVTDSAVSPTCTESGKTEGSHCSRCGAIGTAQQTIPARHNFVTQYESEHPHKEYKKCSTCGYSENTGYDRYDPYCEYCIPQETIPSGCYRIRSKLNGNPYLVVNSDNFLEVSSASSKIFRVDYLGNGYYSIGGISSDSANAQNYSAVLFRTYSGYDWQQWAICKDGDSYLIRSKISNTYIDVFNAGLNGETNLQLYGRNDAYFAQNWYFEPVTVSDWGNWTSISDTQHQRICQSDSSLIETANHNFNGDNICDDCGAEKPPLSGTCGDNLTWTLNKIGTLTISGNGAMNDYSYSFTPWCTNSDSIKKAVIEPGVTSIGDYAFNSCDSLTSVTIGNSVTSIGDYAFHSCDSLTSVTIGNSVTNIGDVAFANCSGLTNIQIPDSVTSIGLFAFAGCSSLTAINVDKDNANYSSINGVLFNKSATELICYPKGLSGIYIIPESVTIIGGEAFYGCSSLTSIEIPERVTNIKVDFFSGCNCLSAINVDKDNANYSSINGVLFNKSATELICYPKGLSGIYIIPESVTIIGGEAFYNCSSLTSIKIPNSVTSIGNYAFFGCNCLSAINVDEDNANYSSINGVLFNKSATELICYPKGLSGIYIIPESVTIIGGEAFYGCSSLTSIKIPNSVTSIGNYAFSDCTAITDVYYYASEEQWKTISIGSRNGYLKNANIHYNYKESYNVSYNANNGSGAPEAQTKAYGETISISSTIPTREGYTFLGWAKSDDATVAEYAAGDNYSEDADVTLYAVWKKTPSGVLTLGGEVSPSGKYASLPFFGLRGVFSSGSLIKHVYAYVRNSAGDDALPVYDVPWNSHYYDIRYDGINEHFDFGILSDGSYTYYVEVTDATGAKETIYSEFSIGDAQDQSSSYETSIFASRLGTVVLTGDSRNDFVNIAKSQIGYYEGNNSSELGGTNSSGSGNYTEYGRVTGTQGKEWCGAFVTWCAMQAGMYKTMIGSILGVPYDAYVSSKTYSNTNGHYGTYHSTMESQVGSVIYPDAEVPLYTPQKGDIFAVWEGHTGIVTDNFNSSTNSISVVEGNAGSATNKVQENIITLKNGRYYLGDRIVCGFLTPDYEKPPLSGTCGDALSWVLGENGTLTISGTGYMEYIGEWAASYDKIKVVVIENGVKSIYSSAFECCVNLESVSIPDSVEIIGDGAFFECTKLKSIELPEGLQSIGVQMFANCTSLSDVLIPDTVTSTGEGSFYNCAALEEIIIPDSVTNIGNNAFCGCTGLASAEYTGTLDQWALVTIGTGNECLLDVLAVDSWIPGSFGKCGENLVWTLSNDGTLTISGSGEMYDYAQTAPENFMQSSAPWMPYYLNITSAVIDEGVSGIGDYAFYGCTSLNTVSISSTVENLGTSAFDCQPIRVEMGYGSGNYVWMNTSGLTAINVAEGNTNYTSVNGVLYDIACDTLIKYPSGLTGSFTVPNTVTIIADRAFFGSSKLTEVSLPVDLTRIGEYVFDTCFALNSIVICDNVENIGMSAFCNCESLSTVYYTGTADDWSKISIATYNAPLTNATFVYNYGSEQLEDFSVLIPAALSENVSITAPSGGWVIGDNTFSASADKACVLAVSYDGGQTYTRLTATANGDGTYNFDVNIADTNTIIACAYKGDVNGDGELTSGDINKLKAAMLKKTDLSALGILTADVNGDNDMTSGDINKLKATMLKKTTIGW